MSDITWCTMASVTGFRLAAIAAWVLVTSVLTFLNKSRIAWSEGNSVLSCFLFRGCVGFSYALSMSIRSASVLAAAEIMRWPWSDCSDCVVPFDESAEVESRPVIIFGVEVRPEASNC